MTIDDKTKINLFATGGILVLVVSASFFIAAVAQKVEANTSDIMLMREANIRRFEREQKIMEILTEIRTDIAVIKSKVR